MHHSLDVEAAASSTKQFVDWEEQFISHDRGSRVVHYLLKDRNGLSSLAVIGTERSLRHMVYVVCDKFLPLAGLDNSNTPAFKWRSRREVVDWLATFISRPHLSSSGSDHNPPKSPKHELFGIFNHDVTSNGDDTEILEGFSQDKGLIDLQNNKQLVVPGKDVVWVGAPWSCRKRLRHYHSFQRNGITISVNAFVYVMSEGREHHIAYIEDMYEDKKCKKKVRVRWFHKTDELIGPVPPPAPLAREVFITPFPQVLSVECVDGRATVLTPEHYEKCLQTLTPAALTQIHLCFRQFDNEGIKPFNISEVKGYWHQEALTIIDSSFPPEQFQNGDLASDSMEMCDEETDIGNVIRRGPRAARSLRRRTGTTDLPNGGCHGDTSTTLQHDIGRLTCDNPADVSPCSNIGETKSQVNGDFHESLDTNDKIELLCEDSGVRGCWFRCTVLQRISCRMKVQYEELEAEDGCGKLEEWVSSIKVAAPDKLGMRALGRLTMRPSPVDVIPHACEVGIAVDAWWNDGWWEGIIAGREADGKVRVYFPDENDMCVFQMDDLRISRDWVHGHWVDVKCKHNVEKIIIARASWLHSGINTSDKNPDNIMRLATLLSCSSGSEHANPFDLSMPFRVTMSAELRTQEFETKKGELDTKNKDPCKETEKPCSEAPCGSGMEEEFECGSCVDACMYRARSASPAADLVEDNNGRVENGTWAMKSNLEQKCVDRDEDGFPDESVISEQSRTKLLRERPCEGHAVALVRDEKSLSIMPGDTTTEFVVDCLQGGERDSAMPSPNSAKESNISKEGDDIEEMRRAKKARTGHENTNPMLGPSSNGSLFMNSVPLASLVMSR